jgi:hypothetical protein
VVKINTVRLDIQNPPFCPHSLCVPHESGNKQRWFCYTVFTDIFFLMEVNCVLYEVQTKYLCTMYIYFSLTIVKPSPSNSDDTAVTSCGSFYVGLQTRRDTHHKAVTFAGNAVRASNSQHCEHIHSNIIVHYFVVSPFTPLGVTRKSKFMAKIGFHISAVSHLCAVLPITVFGWMHMRFFILSTCETNWQGEHDSHPRHHWSGHHQWLFFSYDSTAPRGPRPLHCSRFRDHTL